MLKRTALTLILVGTLVGAREADGIERVGLAVILGEIRLGHDEPHRLLRGAAIAEIPAGQDGVHRNPVGIGDLHDRPHLFDAIGRHRRLSRASSMSASRGPSLPAG